MNTTIQEKLEIIAENEQAVFEAGKNIGRNIEHKAFWDGVQDYGNRVNYERGFIRWNADGIQPLYDMRPTNCSYMFYNIQNGSDFDLAARLQSLGVILDTSATTNFGWMFFSCPHVTHIPEINTTSASAINQTFYDTQAHTIDKLILKDDGSQTFTDTFHTCPNLVDLSVEGTIGQDGFNVSQCKKLSHSSLKTIIDALKNYKGTGITKTITLGSANTKKLTDAEIAIITEEKGWSIA